MIIILTEKPSAAKNFAKALGGNEGIYNGEEYKIVAARGHLLTLVEPSKQVSPALTEQYKKWSLESLPWNMNDLAWKKVLINGAAPVISNIKKALDEADEVVIATDVDPSGEGELLAWEILDYCKWRGSTSRMYFTDEAPKNIQIAFTERKTLKSMTGDGDYVKADTRSKWDFLSMQFSRIATCVAKEKGSRLVIRQGRLKSVMVYMVGEQLKAVNEYKKVPYYELKFKDENGNIFARKPDEDIRLSRKEDIDVSRLHESGIIVDSRNRKKTAPGKLLDLAGLSSILAAKGYKPKNILATYQKMYEAQIVSYPRTEDKEITPEQFNELLPLIDRIAAVVGVDASLITYRQPRSTHVKTGGAHGANRPGINVPKSLQELESYGKEGPAIYEILAKNYLAMMGEDYEYIQEKGHLSDYPEYTAIARIPAALGYKVIFDSSKSLKDKEDESQEENIKALGTNAEPFIYEGANKKPQKPTMKWLKGRLEKYNVGTGATRVSTLAEITESKDPHALMTESKGVLGLTECGDISYKLLNGCAIASVDVTERLFSDMERIGKFELDPESVLRGIDELILHDIEKMKENAGKLVTLSTDSEQESLGKCPSCGKDVYKRNGKKGVFYTCKDTDCKFFINGEIAGKKVTDNQIKALLDKGITAKIKGFTSKAGKTFDAKLTIKDDNTGVEFYFK